MAGANLLTLIDDIATLLDDVATMSKVAVQKTAGVLGDDLALNAQQVAGVSADRELPVVWAVAKGSLLNKAILVPAALTISWFAPALIHPLLMIGGLYLCYEGCEKLAHKFLHNHDEDQSRHAAQVKAVADPAVDLVAFERDKIRGAIRTDFVLSAEIIVIALGSVEKYSFATQVGVLIAISIIMTVGVYGLVGGIVKLDDLGLHLQRSAQAKSSRWRGGLGAGILAFAPKLMKLLSIAGTVAMFLVGGGILLHGVEVVHHQVEHLAEQVAEVAYVGRVLSALLVAALNGLAGVLSGIVVLIVVTLAAKIFRRG